MTDPRKKPQPHTPAWDRATAAEAVRHDRAAQDAETAELTEALRRLQQSKKAAPHGRA